MSKLTDDPSFALPMTEISTAAAPLSALQAATPSSSSSLTTSLPTAADGVECLLTDSLSAPTYVWKLRYNSAASKWYPAAGSWGYGTSLPSPPALVDKVEYTLVDSTTSPTYQWTFTYNVGSSNTEKWEFVGGSSLYSFNATENTTSSGSYGDPANNVSVTVPRAGVYRIDWSCFAKFNSSASNQTGAVCLSIAASDDTNTERGIFTTSETSLYTTLGGVYRTSTIASSSVIKMRFKGPTDSDIKISNKSLAVIPVRLS